MLAALLTLLAPPAPADLPDLLAFRGITREVAALNRDATQRHSAEVLGKLPSDWLRWGWECRQERVWHAWDALADALDAGAPPEIRAARLRNLRWRIGDPAYFAGVMPPPVPAYGQFPPLPPD